jgi:hypothetical protein
MKTPRVIRLLTLVSLLLWLATAGWSARAHWASDHFHVEVPLSLATSPGTPTSQRNATLIGFANSIGVYQLSWMPSGGARTRVFYQRRLASVDQTAYIGYSLTAKLPGVRWKSDPWWGGSVLRIRHWLVSILTSLLPCAALMSRIRRRLRRQTGVCPDCGYDVRASPERCPECGVAQDTDR